MDITAPLHKLYGVFEFNGVGLTLQCALHSARLAHWHIEGDSPVRAVIHRRRVTA